MIFPLKLFFIMEHFQGLIFSTLYIFFKIPSILATNSSIFLLEIKTLRKFHGTPSLRYSSGFVYLLNLTTFSINFCALKSPVKDFQGFCSKQPAAINFFFVNNLHRDWNLKSNYFGKLYSKEIGKAVVFYII